MHRVVTWETASSLVINASCGHSRNCVKSCDQYAVEWNIVLLIQECVAFCYFELSKSVTLKQIDYTRVERIVYESTFSF